MNIPSHYQSAFFDALRQRNEVDLVVRYFYGTSDERSKEGWEGSHELDSFEQCVSGIHSAVNLLETIPDWKERIHIVSSNFSSKLVDYLTAHGAKWCHWSEMPGIRLAELLRYHMGLYRLLNPLMLMLKYKDGRRINLHALVAFGQGALAERAFRLMGIPQNIISDLYYSPAALPVMEPCEQVVKFAGGRKVFLSVGALCRRKGIDILLKAFAELKTRDWCLVLCGVDKSDGAYQKLIEKLRLQEQIFILGAYPVKQIAKVYCASDVLVLASRFDGWGAVLNEAASLGMPLIGTDMCGASWHAIKDGVDGFRVKADSVRALKVAMQSYVENTELIRTHGQKARALFLNTLTPEKNAERLVSALNKWASGVCCN